MVHLSTRAGVIIDTPQGVAPQDFIPIPHSKDEDLKVQMIRDLEVVGPVDDLELIPAILPVISLGSVVQQTTLILQPAFRSTDLFSAGEVDNVAAGAVLADTGQMAAGIFDVTIGMGFATGIQTRFAFEHRDAADAATLATIPFVGFTGSPGGNWMGESFGYEVALNERLRIVTVALLGAGQIVGAYVMARIRP